MLDTTASMIQYSGNGAQTVFPIPFPFREAAHIHAHVTDRHNATRPLASGADYVVAGAELVLVGAPPEAGSVLTIRRLLPMTQEVFFHNQGPNSPQAIEEAVDKLTMLSQQLQAEIDTALRVPEGEAADNAARITAVEQALSAKAEKTHTHAQSAIPGLASALAAKADAAAMAQALGQKASLTQLAAKADLVALAAKADRFELEQKADIAALAHKADAAALALKADKTELAGKAGSVHGHEISAVSGLGALLAAKADADDPRFDAVGGGGGGGDHAALANRDAADQHPQSSIQHLTNDLANIRADLSALEREDESLGNSLAAAAVRLGGAEARIAEISPLAARVTEAETDISALNADVTAVENSLSALGDRLEAKAALAQLEELRAAVEELRELAAAAPSGGLGNGGGIVGEIRLLPFRPDALPAGWHFCDGAALPLSSPAGQALAALPESYRTDWGVAVLNDAITLPSLFDGTTGGGLFPRPVDGASRLPGSAQGDAIRNITGTYNFSNIAGAVLSKPASGTGSRLTGAFTTQATPPLSYAMNPTSYGGRSVGDLLFDASLAVPTAEENRPVNIGMTPAVYLGA